MWHVGGNGTQFLFLQGGFSSALYNIPPWKYQQRLLNPLSCDLRITLATSKSRLNNIVLPECESTYKSISMRKNCFPHEILLFSFDLAEYINNTQEPLKVLRDIPCHRQAFLLPAVAGLQQVLLRPRQDLVVVREKGARVHHVAFR